MRIRWLSLGKVQVQYTILATILAICTYHVHVIASNLANTTKWTRCQNWNNAQTIMTFYICLFIDHSLFTYWDAIFFFMQLTSWLGISLQGNHIGVSPSSLLIEKFTSFCVWLKYITLLMFRGNNIMPQTHALHEYLYQDAANEPPLNNLYNDLHRSYFKSSNTLLTYSNIFYSEEFVFVHRDCSYYYIIYKHNLNVIT